MEHETVAGVASKMTYGGAGGAVFFGLTANEFAALGGLVVALLGLVVSVYFKWAGHREQKAHYRRLEEIEERQ